MKISLLTGGGDPHYALGLLSGLLANKIEVYFIGSNAMKDSDLLKAENVSFRNAHGGVGPSARLMTKSLRVLGSYYKLLKHAHGTDSKLFHILWLNKFIHFDRVLMNLCFKILGKKLIFTAHNVNDHERDGKDNFLNRFSLNILYRLVDHIIVHTSRMKLQLIENFNVKEGKISVIQFGINNIVPKSQLTAKEAKGQLGLRNREKAILFFGNIAPYKGLEYLLVAFADLLKQHQDIRLIIAGRISKNGHKYWIYIQQLIMKLTLVNYTIERAEFIPDKDIEVYFKAADILVLPYRYIFQSGVIFMSYSFGLPVVATNVGSLNEYIIEGKTGFICQPENPGSLTEKINQYFHSDLYKNLENNRVKIAEYASEKYSWEKIGKKTCGVYKSVQ